ncbi:biotin transporter BioY [bacterium]|nr:MAG: biotin transporter BioY [bacterium]
MKVKYDALAWKESLSISWKLSFSFLFACITGLFAQIRIPLPWTSVPVTGQTFAVLLSGIVLGKMWGGVSQLIYVILGILGIPWFSGFKGGINILTGPTMGYLAGFILASLWVGHISERCKKKNFFFLLCMILFANFFLIHLPGLLYLKMWIYHTRGTIPSLHELFVLGTLPFIPGDILKAVFVSICGVLILKGKIRKPQG